MPVVLALLLVAVSLVGCEAPRLPSVKSPGDTIQTALTSDDLDVLQAALEAQVLKPRREHLERQELAGSTRQLPPVLLVDLTLRVCQRIAVPSDCAPDSRNLPELGDLWRIRAGARRAVQGNLGPEVRPLPYPLFSELFETGPMNLDRFRQLYPDQLYTSNVVRVTAPVYGPQMRAYLYVERYGSDGSWLELRRVRGTWAVVGSFGAWQS